MARPIRKKGKKRPQQLIQQPKKREIRRRKDLALRSYLMEIEDLRTFHPRWALRDYKKLDGRDAEIVEGNARNIQKATIGHKYFSDPKKVTVCKRRRERRESLFRQRKIGKGKGVSKIRLRTFKSDIRCK